MLFRSFINKQNIELVFTENIAPALGTSYGGRIAILPGQSEADERCKFLLI